MVMKKTTTIEIKKVSRRPRGHIFGFGMVRKPPEPVASPARKIGRNVNASHR